MSFDVFRFDTTHPKSETFDPRKKTSHQLTSEMFKLQHQANSDDPLQMQAVIRQQQAIAEKVTKPMLKESIMKDLLET